MILIFIFVLIQVAVHVISSSPFQKDTILLLPNNQKCSPAKGSCNKGDLLDPDVADCEFHRKHGISPLTCSAEKSGGIISWVIGPDKDGSCKSKQKGVQMECGSPGTNTRCVCSDYKLHMNTCRCQYWTKSTPGQDEPGYCTAHYLGGDTGIHHYACCNNCIKGSSSAACNNVTYQGGSSGSYCGKCGQPLGGGQLKWYFNCVNCSIQEDCRKKCDKIVSTLPGFCWKWVNCFKGCCTEMAHRKKAADESGAGRIELAAVYPKQNSFGFCGDLVCQSTETVDSCPSDCCPTVNSTCSASICSPLCCAMDSCCQSKIN